MGFSLKWLTTGEGNPYENKEQESAAHPTMRRIGEYAPLEYVKGPDLVDVPVYGVAEAGVMGLEIFEAEPFRRIPILKHFFRAKMIAFDVEGSSMEPTIKRGALSE